MITTQTNPQPDQKVFETVAYTDLQKAYDFLNRWTTNTTSYEKRFQGTKIREVYIILENGRPIAASFHHNTTTQISWDQNMESIYLKPPLRDSQNRPTDLSTRLPTRKC